MGLGFWVLGLGFRGVGDNGVSRRMLREAEMINIMETTIGLRFVEHLVISVEPSNTRFHIGTRKDTDLLECPICLLGRSEILNSQCLPGASHSS